jgi:hypothetical protein
VLPDVLDQPHRLPTVLALTRHHRASLSPHPPLGEAQADSLAGRPSQAHGLRGLPRHALDAVDRPEHAPHGSPKGQALQRAAGARPCLVGEGHTSRFYGAGRRPAPQTPPMRLAVETATQRPRRSPPEPSSLPSDRHWIRRTQLV